MNAPRACRRIGPLLAFLVGCGAAPHDFAGAPPMGPELARGADEAQVPGAMPAAAPAAPRDLPASGTGASTPAVPATAPAGAKSAPASPAASKPATDARIVYTGAIGMREDADKTSPLLDRVVDVAEAAGGHLAGRTDTSITVKIPSAAFRDALTQIDALGEVTKRSVTAEDVSAEFNDLEVRLDNLRATRKRIEEFMARATSLADALAVERELERVTGEIDKIQGRLKFIRERTAFSLLTVTVEARPKKEPTVIVAPPPPPPKPGPRDVRVPAPWLSSLGVADLLKLD